MWFTLFPWPGTVLGLTPGLIQSETAALRDQVEAAELGDVLQDLK